MNKEFLINYLNTNSPSTSEVEAQKVWKNYVADVADEFISDNYGNLCAVIKSKSEKCRQNPYKVLIEAHCDEIGWIVSRITDDGFIYVVSNGGVDYNIVPGQSVKFITDKGIVNGFFGWPPIHLMSTIGNPSPVQSNVFIEVGATNKDEVLEMGIEIGTFIVPDRKAEIINDKYIVSKALDDKLGGFVIAEVAKSINKNELPFDLYIVNAVQEEVGLRGAAMFANRIKPDIAICIDVTHDTTIPLLDKSKVGDYKCGGGVVLSQAPAVQRNLLKLIRQVADENEIPYSLQISQRMTGTNTDSYNLSNSGVTSALISLPLRYMHTPNELASISDTENAIKLYTKVLESIKYQHDFSLF